MNVKTEDNQPGRRKGEKKKLEERKRTGIRTEIEMKYTSEHLQPTVLRTMCPQDERQQIG